MRALLAGVVGSLLLVGGLVVGGTGLALTIMGASCSPHYQLSVQPAGAVADPPDRTVSYESLSAYQQRAVDAALDNRTTASFDRVQPLQDLTDVVISFQGERYVASVETFSCQSLTDYIALGGFAGAIVGFLLGLYALVEWRYS